MSSKKGSRPSWWSSKRGYGERNLEGDLAMKTSKLLVAAVLATAIGAPIAGFVAEMKGQSMTSTGVRVPFLHGLPIGQNADQSALASLDRASAWLNSPP